MHWTGIASKYFLNMSWDISGAKWCQVPQLRQAFSDQIGRLAAKPLVCIVHLFVLLLWMWGSRPSVNTLFLSWEIKHMRSRRLLRVWSPLALSLQEVFVQFAVWGIPVPRIHTTISDHNLLVWMWPHCKFIVLSAFLTLILISLTGCWEFNFPFCNHRMPCLRQMSAVSANGEALFPGSPLRARQLSSQDPPMHWREMYTNFILNWFYQVRELKCTKIIIIPKNALSLCISLSHNSNYGALALKCLWFVQ